MQGILDMIQELRRREPRAITPPASIREGLEVGGLHAYTHLRQPTLVHE